MVNYRESGVHMEPIMQTDKDIYRLTYRLVEYFNMWSHSLMG